MRYLTSLFVLIALAACGQYDGSGQAGACGGEPSGPWQPVATRAAATTGSLDCGDEDTIYTNNTGKAKAVSVEIDNKCEFTAYLWTYDANGAIVRIRNIPGYDSLNDTIGVEAGGELYLICTLVSTIENDGCSYSVTVLAET